MKNFGLRLKGCRNCYFWSLPFLFFHISNDYCQKCYGKTIFFYEGFSRVLMKFYTSRKFWIYILLTIKRWPFWNLEISTEIHFVSLFFLNERNIATSLLIIHLKCTAVHYANLNSNSINKPYLRSVEYAISFFSISYLCLF